ncbi:MAG: peptidoglycan DD-metalloendopeptidase family protein [Piscirickettsiaceae bacterium]|nr:peptidoglycan DD-metalloendopeptidase family protein [Piscirickettsiaceae bacterium]
MKKQKPINYLEQYKLSAIDKSKYYKLFVLSFLFCIGTIYMLQMTNLSKLITPIRNLLPLSLNNNRSTSPILTSNTITTISNNQISRDDSFIDTKKQDQVEQLNWRKIIVKSGDNLSSILFQVGLNTNDVYKIVHLGKNVKPLLDLKPNQTIQFGFSNKIIDKNSLRQLDLQLSPTTNLIITATTTGYETKINIREIESRRAHACGKITSSLFEAGLRANLSEKLIMELSYIFGWDIDFSLDLRVGDRFKLIYEESYLEGNKITDSNVLAAEITNRGKILRAIRYTDDTGVSNFYTPNGESMHRTFIRSPVNFSYISSKFSPKRKHPILQTKRPHRGVDYAAPKGTPIIATGDGKVSFVGIKGSYGRTIILIHAGKYTTLYAHMSKYKNGIEQGKRIKQGDIIGYIGKSGLATGPHLHYEFRVNGIHRNPLSMTLPKSKPLLKKYLSDFKSKMRPLVISLDKLKDTTSPSN